MPPHRSSGGKQIGRRMPAPRQERRDGGRRVWPVGVHVAAKQRVCRGVCRSAWGQGTLLDVGSLVFAQWETGSVCACHARSRFALVGCACSTSLAIVLGNPTLHSRNRLRASPQ